MILHRHKKLIMGGGVCLLIALTGVVATASVATTLSTDTSYIETRDTAEIAVRLTDTIDVATTDEQESVYTPSRSATSSQKIASKHNAVAISSKSTVSQKITSEPMIADTASQATAIQETTFKLEIEETASQPNSQETTLEDSKDEANTSSAASVPSWDGPILNASAGIVQGPSGSETFYNLDMSGVIYLMKNLGYDYDYWIRDDGVKMYGKYVMCAADLSIRPKGTILETSLGPGIVCDTGSFVTIDSNRLDIAVNW